MSKRVGYKNPPEHSRFKKGQSGNPSGRPKRPPDLQEDLAAELSETIQINEGGKVRRITKQRALVKAMTAGGIKGNARAAQLLMSWCAQVIEANPELPTPADMSDADRKIIEDYLERQVQLRLAQRKGDV